MLINLSDNNSLISQYVYEIRDTKIQADRMRFRKNLERIGEIMAYEISKKLKFNKKNIETCLGPAECQVLAESPVVATILRAGLPLHAGILNYFDMADNAFVSAYRKHDTKGDFEIQLEYCSCPDLSGKTLIIADPMLATGSSAVLTIKELLKFGKPSSTHLVSGIASKAGVDKVHSFSEDIFIWTGAVDPELNSKAYIVPGLGDAGDLAFGPKLQS